MEAKVGLSSAGNAIGGQGRLRCLEMRRKPAPICAGSKGLPTRERSDFHRSWSQAPPGSGKSTQVRRLGGWPEEGCLDLSARCWWRSRVLALRPREIHLRLPWPSQRLMQNQGEEALEAELEQMPMPRQGTGLLTPNWRRRFLFEFLLPPAAQIYCKRKERAGAGSHPVDRDISLELVQAQLRGYELLAGHLHRNGFQVLVRNAFDGPPLWLGNPVLPAPAPASLFARVLRAPAPPAPG